jgi:hypothetical protein
MAEYRVKWTKRIELPVIKVDIPGALNIKDIDTDDNRFQFSQTGRIYGPRLMENENGQGQ